MTVLEEISNLISQAKQYKLSAEGESESSASRSYQKAASSYARAAELADGILGPYHDQTLNYRDYRAAALRDAGDLKGSIQCNRAAVQNYKLRWGDFADRTLDAERRLAENYLANKQFDDAIKLYKDIVQAGESARKSASVICQDRADWAFALFETKNPQNIRRAININHETLQTAQQSLGPDHIEVAKVRYNLGTELMELSKFQDASNKLTENVSILQSKTCRSRHDPEYADVLQDSKTSLQTCKIIMAQEKSKQAPKDAKQVDKLDMQQIQPAHSASQKQAQTSQSQKVHGVQEQKFQRQAEVANSTKGSPLLMNERSQQVSPARREKKEPQKKEEKKGAGLLITPQKQKDAAPVAYTFSLERVLQQFEEEMEGKRQQREENPKKELEKHEIQSKIQHNRREMDKELACQEGPQRQVIETPKLVHQPSDDQTRSERARKYAESRNVQKHHAQGLNPEATQYSEINPWRRSLPAPVTPGSIAHQTSENHPIGVQWSSKTPAADGRSYTHRRSISHEETRLRSASQSQDAPSRGKSHISHDSRSSLGSHPSSNISRAKSVHGGSLASQPKTMQEAPHHLQTVPISIGKPFDGTGQLPKIKGADDSSSQAQSKRKSWQDMSNSSISSDQAVKVPEIHLESNTSLKQERHIPGGWQQAFDVEEPSERHVRKMRSIDGASETRTQQTTTAGSSHKRASSTEPPRVQRSPRDRPISLLNFFAQDANRADDWFAELADDAHCFLDKYKDDTYTTNKAARPIKIAVLDTGIAKRDTLGAPVPELVAQSMRRIKLGKQLDDSLPPHEDVNGHGTHTAGLVLQVCPYAVVYVYRVAQDEQAIETKHVTKALEDAIKKKVDIVSMSFGWQEDSDKDLRAVIQQAAMNDILLFAASSNDGARTKGGMAYPARAHAVIAVDSADVHGKPSRFNPLLGDKLRFTALGEAVRSAYPTHLFGQEDEERGWKRMSGTSVATPIAAGIAGLILEFSRQRPLCLDPSIEAHLKSVEGMQEVLSHLFSFRHAEGSLLDPNRHFRTTERYKDGGPWHKNSTPRLNAANLMVDCLRTRFSGDIGILMDQEIEKEYERRAGRGGS